MEMTKAQAKKQLEVFFEKLGDTNPSIFEGNNFVKATLGDAIMGFVYEDDDTLKCQSLIYRFRKKPKEAVMNAIEIESQNAPNGADIAFDEANFTLVLQKNYTEKISDDDFYKTMQGLAESSFVWSNEILDKVAKRAYSN